MILFLPVIAALLATLAKGGLLAAKGAATVAPAIGKGALAGGKTIGGGIAKGGKLLGSAGSGLKGDLSALKPGEGEPLLQGLFDALGGTNVESTGKIGEIAKAEKLNQGGFISDVLRRGRAGAAEGLQSGLKDVLMNALAGQRGQAPAQAGGITFPTVPGPTRTVGPGIEPTPLPNHDRLLADLAVRRQQILDEILASSGSFR